MADWRKAGARLAQQYRTRVPAGVRGGLGLVGNIALWQGIGALEERAYNYLQQRNAKGSVYAPTNSYDPRDHYITTNADGSFAPANLTPDQVHELAQVFADANNMPIADAEEYLLNYKAEVGGYPTVDAIKNDKVRLAHYVDPKAAWTAVPLAALEDRAAPSPIQYLSGARQINPALQSMDTLKTQGFKKLPGELGKHLTAAEQLQFLPMYGVNYLGRKIVGDEFAQQHPVGTGVGSLLALGGATTIGGKVLPKVLPKSVLNVGSGIGKGLGLFGKHINGIDAAASVLNTTQNAIDGLTDNRGDVGNEYRDFANAWTGNTNSVWQKRELAFGKLGVDTLGDLANVANDYYGHRIPLGMYGISPGYKFVKSVAALNKDFYGTVGDYFSNDPRRRQIAKDTWKYWWDGSDFWGKTMFDFSDDPNMREKLKAKVDEERYGASKATDVAKMRRDMYSNYAKNDAALYNQWRPYLEYRDKYGRDALSKHVQNGKPIGQDIVRALDKYELEQRRALNARTRSAMGLDSAAYKDELATRNAAKEYLDSNL